VEVLLCWLVGLLFAVSIYLLLHQNLVRVLFGIMLIGSSINLLIFTVGRLTQGTPAFLNMHEWVPSQLLANALPQALILTAIVIGFGVVSYSLILIIKTWQELGTMNSDEMHVSEDINYDNEDIE
jgi:multicomponent Na+:H+ antiporter subunit C